MHHPQTPFASINLNITDDQQQLVAFWMHDADTIDRIAQERPADFGRITEATVATHGKLAPLLITTLRDIIDGNRNAVKIFQDLSPASQANICRLGGLNIAASSLRLFNQTLPSPSTRGQ